MKTLMELISTAKTEDEQNVKETTFNIGNELKELGFNKMSDKILKSVQRKNKITAIAKQKYLKVTTEMINNYLDNKVNEYNKINSKDDLVLMQSNPLQHWIPESLFDGRISYKYNFISSSVDPFPGEKSNSKIITIEKCTCDYNSMKSGTVGKFVWKECPIEEYEGIPPKEVLDKLRIHKDKLLFDYFTIALVKNVKDPLLFGRINENDNRYFIAQWGCDVQLDDLI